MKPFLTSVLTKDMDDAAMVAHCITTLAIDGGGLIPNVYLHLPRRVPYALLTGLDAAGIGWVVMPFEDGWEVYALTDAHAFPAAWHGLLMDDAVYTTGVYGVLAIDGVRRALVDKRHHASELVYVAKKAKEARDAA